MPIATAITMTMLMRLELVDVYNDLQIPSDEQGIILNIMIIDLYMHYIHSIHFVTHEHP